MPQPSGTDTTQAKRIVAARAGLILDQPFFGALALRLKIVESTRNTTAWTDGVHLGYNPAFIRECTHDHIVAVLGHEVMHCAAGHPWRKDGRDHDKWNEACDRAINPVLRDAGMTLPPNVLYELEPSHLGKSAEWIYARLPKGSPSSSGQGSGQGQGSGGGAQPQPQPGPAGKQGASSTPAPGQGQSQDPSAAGPPQPSKRGSGPQGRNDPPSGRSPATGQAPQNGTMCPNDTPALGEVFDAPPEGEPDGPDHGATEEGWRQATEQAAMLARGQGKLPGSLKRFTKEARASRVDWRSALRRFAQETARADYSYARPNARYLASGFVLPSLRNHEVGEIVVGVDTSGSVDAVLLGQFEAEIRAIADEVKPRAIRVLYCDAVVNKEDVFERDDLVKLVPCGGGGTDFRPVFKRAENLDEPPVCVIYLTDLMGTFPKDSSIPTLWVTGTNDARKVPFGELVRAA